MSDATEIHALSPDVMGCHPSFATGQVISIAERAREVEKGDSGDGHFLTQEVSKGDSGGGTRGTSNDRARNEISSRQHRISLQRHAQARVVSGAHCSRYTRGQGVEETRWAVVSLFWHSHSLGTRLCQASSVVSCLLSLSSRDVSSPEGCGISAHRLESTPGDSPSGGYTPSVRDLVDVAVLVGDVRIRDVLWLAITVDNAERYCTAWQRVLAIAGEHSPGVASLYAFSLWMTGEEEKCLTVINNVLETHPRYSAAHIIADLVISGLTPQDWLRWCEVHPCEVELDYDDMRWQTAGGQEMDGKTYETLPSLEAPHGRRARRERNEREKAMRKERR